MPPAGHFYFVNSYYAEPATPAEVLGVTEYGVEFCSVAARGLREAALFTGAVAPHQVPGLLASMDVAVAPYPKLANFYFSPLKVYEYMAAGLPVVASRIGQLTQVLRHEETGLLCPPGDAAALAAALERLRCDPALRKRLGAAARATALKKHTWDAVARRILSLATRQPAHALTAAAL